MKFCLLKACAFLLVSLTGLRASETQTALWLPSVHVPSTASVLTLPNVRFSVIKPYEFNKDGYRFLHGIALSWHKGRLYASFAHNKGIENTGNEEANYCVSDDNGETWSAVSSIDKGGEIGSSVSHGVFLSYQNQLWAFHGAFTGFLQKLHTVAYKLDEIHGAWVSQGTVITDGFWPYQEPLKMNDGNWIMSGFRVNVEGEENKYPSAVAISRGDDFTKWDVVPIRASPSENLWGESTVFVNGNHIVNIARYGSDTKALIAMSEDYGRHWTASLPSNLPMTTSKPYAGTLSTGENYLICTTTGDSGRDRSPLTIALTRPGKNVFEKVYAIRHAESSGLGESHSHAALSYPYAIEQGGYLYVAYSNSGGEVGRVGKGRELANNNSAELAVIPIESLQVTP